MTPTGPVTLRTGRLELVEPSERHVADLVEVVRSSIPELSRWMPWATEAFDQEAARARMRRARVLGDREFLVYRAGTLVGAVGINDLRPEARIGNLAYWVQPRHTGAGIATEAAAVVVRFGIDRLRLQRVEILMEVGNTASRRVAERLGATYEGVLRRRIPSEGDNVDAWSFSFVPSDLSGPPG